MPRLVYLLNVAPPRRVAAVGRDDIDGWAFSDRRSRRIRPFTLCRVDALGVDTDGLAVLAGECELLASRLSNLPAAPRSGSADQASTAAVGGVHVGIGSTGAAVVARMQSTAARLAAANIAYVDRDVSAAGLLHTARDALEA